MKSAASLSFFCFSLLIIAVVWTVKQISLPADSGDYLKWVLRLSDSESLVPSNEQVCSYENKVTPSTSWWPGASWRG